MASKSTDWDDTKNVMKEAFQNPNFNRYDMGPGADLDAELQPGALAAEPAVAKVFDVHIANLSKEWTEQGIRNICIKYGRVLHVIRHDDKKWAIVKFDTLSASENAVQGLNTMPGMQFRASFAKKNPNNDHEVRVPDNGYVNNGPPRRRTENDIDWQRRQIQGPFSLPNNVKAKQLPPNLWQRDYDQVPNLRRIDPNMDFSHSDSSYLNNRSGVRNGTHVYHDTQEDIEKMRQSAAMSNGSHEKNGYISSTRTNPLLDFQCGPCTLCENEARLTCSRCKDWYCSVSCQTQDWRQHRKICFPMPDLVPLVTNAAAALPKTPPKTMTKPCNGYVHTNGESSNHKSSRNDVNQKEPLSPSRRAATTEESKRTAKAISSKVVETTASPPPAVQTHTKPLKTTESVAEPPKTAIMELSPPPTNNTDVMLTHIHNHRTVFLRSSAPIDNTNYLQNLNECAEYVKIAKPLSVRPTVGDIVLANFVGIYYRALVLKVNSDDDIKVGFVDFGNTEKTRLSELKDLRDDLKHRQRYNYRVTLEGVHEKLTNDAVMKYLNGLLDVGKVLKLYYDDTKPLKDTPVKLVDIETADVVNECVNDFNRVEPAQLNDRPFGLDALEMVDISGENVELTVLDNKQLLINVVSCVRTSDLEELATNSTRFQDYCNENHETYTPRLYELCLALGDDKEWYRGQCMELAGDGYPLIALIDYGSMQIVAIENIRKMPRQFTHRLLTMDCSIDGLASTISLTECNKLKSFFKVATNITAKRVKKIAGTHSFKIEVPNILAEYHAQSD